MHHLTLGAIGLSALIAGAAFPEGQAAAQTAKDVVGTWTWVSNTVDQGGKKVEPFGPDGKGILIFGSDGRYALINLRSGLPKFASGNRTTGTPDENKAIVEGSIAHYGTYTVDEAGKTLVLRVEASTFPNWDKAEQRRPFTLSGDELTYTVPAASVGGTAKVVWKRAK